MSRQASAAAVPLLVLCDAVAGAGASELGGLLGRFARRALDGHVMLLAGPPAGDGRSAPLADACGASPTGCPCPAPSTASPRAITTAASYA